MSKRLERWQKPFKNLPRGAMWVTAAKYGDCYCYEDFPKALHSMWFVKRTKGSFWIGTYKPPAHWTISIRSVKPEERVGYKPEAKP